MLRSRYRIDPGFLGWTWPEPAVPTSRLDSSRLRGYRGQVTQPATGGGLLLTDLPMADSRTTAYAMLRDAGPVPVSYTHLTLPTILLV